MTKHLTHMLHVYTGERRVAFGAHPLALPSRFVRLYGLLALRWLEVGEYKSEQGDDSEGDLEMSAPDPYVTVPEIAHLDKWRESAASGADIGQLVYNHARDAVKQNPALERLFPEQPTLIASPKGSTQEAFRLRDEVSGIWVDGLEGRAAISRLRGWLGLPTASWDSADPVPFNPLQYDAAKLAQRYALAKAAFEGGDYGRAAHLLNAMLAAIAELSGGRNFHYSLCPSVAIWHLRALCLQSWLLTVNDKYKAAHALNREIQDQLGRYIHRQYHLPKAVEGLVWLQRGRFHARKHETDKAERNYVRARARLATTDYYEHAAVCAGLGYVAQQRGQLDLAEEHYRQSLQLFTRVADVWGIHAQYDNLAAIAFLRHIESGDPHDLDAAMHYCEISRDMLEGGGIKCNIDVYVNLAYAYRLQGLAAESWKMARTAQAVAETSGSESDMALALAELAECHIYAGELAEARAVYGECLPMFERVGVATWVQQVTERIAALEAGQALGPSLHLW